LRTSEERYRALFEQARDGIGVVRISDHRLVEANNRVSEILGRRQQDYIGHDIRELFRSTTPHALEVTMIPNGQPSAESELTIQTERGQTVPVSISFTPLTAGGEEVMIMSLRDLSLRKKLEADREEMQRQLYQSSKLASIGELSAGVAHEINNPLNGIINFAQLLKDEDRPRTGFEQQMIDGIIDEGQRIARIVRGLLTFASADTPELRPVHFAESIETSIALFGRQFEKDGITVEMRRCSGSGSIAVCCETDHEPEVSLDAAERWRSKVGRFADSARGGAVSDRVDECRFARAETGFGRLDPFCATC
jgi:PAS domain S-box-containing protein